MHFQNNPLSASKLSRTFENFKKKYTSTIANYVEKYLVPELHQPTLSQISLTNCMMDYVANINNKFKWLHPHPVVYYENLISNGFITFVTNMSPPHLFRKKLIERSSFVLMNLFTT